FPLPTPSDSPCLCFVDAPGTAAAAASPFHLARPTSRPRATLADGQTAQPTDCQAKSAPTLKLLPIDGTWKAPSVQQLCLVFTCQPKFKVPVAIGLLQSSKPTASRP